MKQQSIHIIKKRYWYAVYHTGTLEDGMITYNKETTRKVGKIRFDITRQEYKYYPSIWYIMSMRVQQCEELKSILTRLNKGERL